MIRKSIEAFALWLLIVLCLGMLLFIQSTPLTEALLILWILIPAISWFQNWFLIHFLELSIKGKPSAEKKENVTGSIEIRNESIFPMLKIYCMVQVRNRFTGDEKKICIPMSAAPRDQGSQAFEVCSEYCGYLDLSIRKVYLMDWFGFLPVKKSLKADAHTVILPDTFLSNVCLQMKAEHKDATESWSTLKKGNDQSELFALREYIPGDHLKQIHWKLSAKKNQLIVKEPSLPIEKSLLIFWDKNAEVCTPKEMDAMAEGIASIGENILSQGISFVLGWTEGRNQMFETIDQEEQLLQAIPRMIKYGSDLSAKDEIMEETGVFSKILLFSGKVPENVPFFCDDITFFVCHKGAETSPVNVISFGADTYLEDLEYIEI